MTTQNVQGVREKMQEIVKQVDEINGSEHSHTDGDKKEKLWYGGNQQILALIQ